MGYISSLDPIEADGIGVLLLDNGRTIVRLDPLPDSAADYEIVQFNAYVAAIRNKGHRTIVGDFGAYSRVLAEMVDRGEL